MSAKLIYITDENRDMVSFYARKKGRKNDPEHARMKRILLAAIKKELTPMQRFCITEHCLNGKKQKEIAEQLGLNCSTVSRHIAAGKRKLRGVADCYEN